MRWRLKIAENKDPVEVELLSIEGETYRFKVGKKEINLKNPKFYPFAISTDEIHLTLEAWNKKSWRVSEKSQTYSIEPQSFEGENADSQNEIRTQMPGRVLKILVKPGDPIEANQTLVVMEAMKMENEMRAVAKGKVKSVAVAAGASVESGTLLLELESA